MSCLLNTCQSILVVSIICMAAVIFTDKISDQHRILYEASIYKRASRQRTLALRSNMELEAVEEDVDVSLMSELQDKQASHAENIIQEMTQKVQFYASYRTDVTCLKCENSTHYC